MYTLKNIQEELKIKERKISDLIRFIETRTDDNPNYSLFLGAGCSITSGIRSATELIKEWKRDIFYNMNELEEESTSDIEKYIESQPWYNPRNPYSSLFEKKYDLPRQRRMFVEKEVRDKIPSIGYAYLTKLVERNYFKAIFTTNFDDLLNEAFYQYSNERPLICAHDSAINSITVTSKRAKVIKLHGDYLFDDIKSTLRETESLEENIKNKFIEFAKDYGLIVVGYAGNDRSIVDVLTYLLKNEEYFRNGIYWCIREDSEINDDLKKLLWKDRVYYVVVDGFDELFAQIHSKLLPENLPIDSSFLNEKKQDMINHLLENNYLKKSNSEILKKDLNKIKNSLNNDVIHNFINYLNNKNLNDEDIDNETNQFSKKNSITKLTKEEEKFTLEIQTYIVQKDFETALKKINSEINRCNNNSFFKKILLTYKLKCCKGLKKEDELVLIYRNLIEEYNDSPLYYKDLAKLKSNYRDKITVLDEGISYFKYDSSLYYNKSELVYLQMIDIVNDSIKEKLKEDLIICLDKGIELNPSIKYPGWELKFKYIQESNSSSKIQDLKDLINNYKKQDPINPSIIKKEIKIMKLDNYTKDKIYDFLIKKITNNNNNNNYSKSYEFFLLEEYAYYNDIDLLNDRFKYIESNFNIDDDYKELKARLLVEKYNKLNDAIELLESIQEKNKSIYKTLCKYNLFRNDYERARKIYNDYIKNDKEIFCDILSKEGNYSEALRIIEEKHNENEYNEMLIVAKSFYYLKLNRYKDAKDLTFKYLNKNQHKSGPMLINYHLALKLEGKTIDRKKIEEKIINNKNSNEILKAAGYALLDDKNNAIKNIKKAIKEDYSEFYIIQDWEVFKNINSSEYRIDCVPNFV